MDMNGISTATHHFRRGSALRDGTCLFWSFLLVIKPLLIYIFGNVPFNRDLWEALNEDLRIRVAEYIFKSVELRKNALNSDSGYTNIRSYCLAIIQGRLWDGAPELRTLTKLYSGIIICVIDPTKIGAKNCLILSYYGQDNPSAKYCVYIYHNGRDHFDPLFMVNKTKSNEICTIFPRNNQMVNEILKEFITNELERK